MYQEIAILKKLDHPNVVKLVEVRREADGLAPALLISKYLFAKISRLRTLWPHIPSHHCFMLLSLPKTTYHYHFTDAKVEAESSKACPLPASLSLRLSVFLLHTGSWNMEVVVHTNR